MASTFIYLFPNSIPFLLGIDALDVPKQHFIRSVVTTVAIHKNLKGSVSTVCVTKYQTGAKMNHEDQKTQRADR
jgi:hypothetical protein